MSLLLFDESIIFLSWQYFGEILSSYCDNFDIIVLNSDLDIFLHYVDLFIKYIAIISIILRNKYKHVKLFKKIHRVLARPGI